METKPFDQIIADFRSTFQAVQEEEKQRASIKATDEFQSLQDQIDELTKQQDALLAVVPDSKEEYEADKAELIAYMTENNLTQAEEFTAKTRAKRSVDVYATLQALDGDIDSLMLVTSVTQTALTKFMKENKEYAGRLKHCIKEEGFSIVDILPPQES